MLPAGPYPSGLMAEFQWWLLIVGLVAGGGLVAVVSMDSRRREQDLADLERRAEAAWIAARMDRRGRPVDSRAVEEILRDHREYLELPPPDRIVVQGTDEEVADAPGVAGGWRALSPSKPEPEALDGDPDGMPDEVGDDRGSGADADLAGAGEEQAPAGEEAHAGADGEQRRD